MKKILILLLIFSLILFISCRREEPIKKVEEDKKEEKVKEQVNKEIKKIEKIEEMDEEIKNYNTIPFLTFSYNEKEELIEVYLNYWNLNEGKIIETNKILYILKGYPRLDSSNKIPIWGDFVMFTGKPLSWDGESYIYLSNYQHEVKNPLYFNIYMFNIGTHIVSPFFYGITKDLLISGKNEKNYFDNPYASFTFTTFNGEKVIEKNINISLYNDVFHGAVPLGQAYLYNSEEKIVKALHLYYDNDGVGHFIICKIDLEKEKYEWHEVSNIKGCIPFMDSMDISIIGKNFYVPLCGNYIGEINSEDYSFKIAISEKELLNSLKFYNPLPSLISYPYPRILGEFRNFIILNIDLGKRQEPASFPENWKHIYLAYNIKTKKVEGIMEWDSLNPEFFVLRDENGNELYRVEVEKLIKNLRKIPCLKGDLLISGNFIYSCFIRFPHKNGY